MNLVYGTADNKIGSISLQIPKFKKNYKDSIYAKNLSSNDFEIPSYLKMNYTPKIKNP